MLSSASKKRLRKIISLAVPSGINSLLDIVAIAINMLFMSSISDSHTLAMGLSLNFLMIFYAFNAIFSVGTNVQISHYFGAGEQIKIKEVFSSIVQGSLVVSIPLIFIGIYSAEFFFNWMGIYGEVRHLALNFSNYIVLTLPALILKNIFIAALAAVGNTLYPLIVRIISIIISVALTYILVFGYNLDMEGAGIAYLATGYLELIIFFLMFFIKKIFSNFLVFKKEYLLNMFRIGIPAGIERFLTLSSLILITKIVSSYSDLVLTGAQIGNRIEAFSFMPSFGFMLAAMVLMGQNLGARKVEEAKIYIKTILGFSSCIMGISSILLITFAKYFSSLFSSNGEIIATSAYYLVAVGLSQIPLIWVFVLDGALRGAGNTKTALCVNVVSIWFFRILPMFLLAKMQFPITWIFGIICIETYIRAYIFWIIFKRGRWENFRV
ncbi:MULTISPECIES: MATE family efflux transporter [unclassified Helicobacter]|uniref:MATE family efflux transporter n=1 Tax=unclassified Helicobacter TaxID=2593540 RepID=UPI000CF0FE85|nr:MULTISPECIES: MATE family efflux transporter [unclassified Helicobacter]